MTVASEVGVIINNITVLDLSKVIPVDDWLGDVLDANWRSVIKFGLQIAGQLVTSAITLPQKLNLLPLHFPFKLIGPGGLFDVNSLIPSIPISGCVGGTEYRKSPNSFFASRRLALAGPEGEGAGGRQLPIFAGTWAAGNWSACSVECGLGSMTRAIYCLDARGLAIAPVFCDAAALPPATQACDMLLAGCADTGYSGGGLWTASPAPLTTSTVIGQVLPAPSSTFEWTVQLAPPLSGLEASLVLVGANASTLAGVHVLLSATSPCMPARKGAAVNAYAYANLTLIATVEDDGLCPNDLVTVRVALAGASPLANASTVYFALTLRPFVEVSGGGALLNLTAPAGGPASLYLRYLPSVGATGAFFYAGPLPGAPAATEDMQLVLFSAPASAPGGAGWPSAASASASAADSLARTSASQACCADTITILDAFFVDDFYLLHIRSALSLSYRFFAADLPTLANGAPVGGAIASGGSSMAVYRYAALLADTEIHVTATTLVGSVALFASASLGLAGAPYVDDATGACVCPACVYASTPAGAHAASIKMTAMEPQFSASAPFKNGASRRCPCRRWSSSRPLTYLPGHFSTF